ncbi:ribonuclease H-like domain-containing protein [Sporodiniella umbellata]|nr:ribonuclease H-like domain-containing protein [Sporodiniella umbellata]
MLGVDEAGRGPCLGPMVYAICYCPISRLEDLKKLCFDDSKKLTKDKRDRLAKVIEQNKDWIGWAVYVISPQDISYNMLKRPVFNLNEMAHDATIRLIQEVIKNQVNLEQIFVDPVGPSVSYQRKLSSFFPGRAIVVEPKADALYPVVSAASICAKVTRDQYVENWVWTEPEMDNVSKAFGSGYPADPNTVRWLDQNQDSFFGFPTLVRFSWKTIAARVDSQHNWSEDEDEIPTPKHPKTKPPTLHQKPEEKYNYHRKGKFIAGFCLDVESDL